MVIHHGVPHLKIGIVATAVFDGGLEVCVSQRPQFSGEFLSHNLAINAGAVAVVGARARNHRDTGKHSLDVTRYACTHEQRGA